MEEDNKILDKYVGQKIRQRRKTLGLTQAELADILGLSYQQVQRYESGENTIAMSRMLTIADSLNVDLGYFYESAPLMRAMGKKIASGIIAKDFNRPLRLLLVEDTSTDELLFRKAAEKSDVEVEIHAIQDPQQVMGYLHECDPRHGSPRPDIIFLDINMPRLNGLELLKKIKSAQEFRMLPVIILTNSVRSKEMQRAYADHASGFIQKNSDLQKFYEDIHIMLQYWKRTVILPCDS